MPYCQNCGTESNGNFCPKCGAQAGAVISTTPQLVIHKDADVKPRYSTGAIVLAGYLGLGCFLATLFFLGVVFSAPTSMKSSDVLVFLLVTLFLLTITTLCYFPAIKSIRKRSPEGMFAKTLTSFLIKSFLFLICWSIAIVGSMFIIGLFFGVYRVGLWVSKPNADEYTAFVDGKKIPVTKLYDNLPDYGPKGEYVYQDENGEFYRPPVR